jgi:hypothetical protein
MLNKINFVEVQSSNVVSVGYKDNNLYVNYKSGTYKYENVDKSVFESLLSSESKGRFMNEHIKGNYECVRIQQ